MKIATNINKLVIFITAMIILFSGISTLKVQSNTQTENEQNFRKFF
jgi:hypothetical protein